MKRIKESFCLLAKLSLVAVLLSSCRTTPSGTRYWRGADVGWLTELESRGATFHYPDGTPSECMSLLRSYGLDAVRLRVWVDPSAHGGWCDTRDLLVKARRADSLGLAVMVDFHYSDFWADPKKQNIPAGWSGKPYEEVLDLLGEHTREVLSALKAEGIAPRWVQVGNETSKGMLWTVRGDEWGDPIPDEDGNITILESLGHLDMNPSQYAGFVGRGYESVKEVFPDAMVIVHLDNGFDQDLYDRNLDTLRKYGALWDMVGLSVYPFWAEQSGLETDPIRCIDRSIDNINHIWEKYSTPTMIVETGFKVDESHPEVMSEGRRQLEYLIERSSSLGEKCQGVFYWEPECSSGTYSLGAFTSRGTPTEIMEAFRK